MTAFTFTTGDIDAEIKFWSKSSDSSKNVYDIKIPLSGLASASEGREAGEAIIAALKAMNAQIIDQRTLLREATGRTFMNDGELLMIEKDGGREISARFHTDLELSEIKNKLVSGGLKSSAGSPPPPRTMESDMSDAFSTILTAAQRGDLARLRGKVTKADFFTGDPPAIQADAVLSNIGEVVEMLAERGEFITEKEWNEPRHGWARNKSLADLAHDAADQIIIRGGTLYTQRTIGNASLEEKPPVEKPLPKPVEADEVCGQEGGNIFAKFRGKISRETLMKPQRDKSTLLRKAIEGGLIGEVLEMLAENGDKITRDDLLQRDANAPNTNIEQIAQQGQLSILFQPANWINNVREMQEVWARVPKKHHAQLDGRDDRPAFKRLMQEANAASIKALQTGTRAVGE